MDMQKFEDDITVIFDLEGLSADAREIMDAVAICGSVLIFKNGMPVYEVIPYSRAETVQETEKGILSTVEQTVASWMAAKMRDPNEIGLNNLLFRLALQGVSLDYYTDELDSLEELTDAETLDHEAICQWIWYHLK